MRGEGAFAEAAPARVGRHGVIAARFERAGGRTILRDSYFRVPLQVIRPLYPEGGDPAHLFLINPTGGHVGGDVLETRLELGAGARVLCTTQGATRVYRSAGEPVRAAVEVRLAEGACLELLPDPIIPYRGAVYRQDVDVELSAGARLLYGEMLYHGRVASGEWFGYSSLRLRLRARLEGAPLLADALEVRPEAGAPEGLGRFEPHPYLGSFYALGGEEEALARAAEGLEEMFASAAPGLAGGASRLAGPGLLVRWLAESPPRLRGAFDAVWDICRTCLLGRPAVRLRKF